MKKQSQNIRNKRLSEKDQKIWVYKQGRGNFGFVDIVKDGVKKWYYVHESKKADALPGDEVFFTTKIFRGKEEAVITGVSQRSENLIIWKLRLNKNFAFVVPEDTHIRSDIFIPGRFTKWHSDGERVWVQVINWKKRNPEGRIVESLHSFPEGRQEIYKIALEWWARVHFSSKVLTEVKSIPKGISNQEVLKRKDLRKQLIFTIDGAESKDLDDALSIEKKENGNFVLSVHIADVAHYVTENSELDREARQRATSIYLCDQVIPMLPKEISNGVCSLHPWEDKLTLTCEMEINTVGHVVWTRVFESVIQSQYRLTYKEVQEVLESGKKSWELFFWWSVTGELFDALKHLKSVKHILSKYKTQKWVLSFDFPETKVEIDKKGNPLKFYKYERYESHKIIEECMVLTNEWVGESFTKIPFLYRIHEIPDEEDVEGFQRLLEKFWVTTWKLEITPKWFQSILSILQKDEKLKPLQRLLLRTLTKAIYSEKNLWHFGLGSSRYSHFTSPIRRYPDLQIHRIIKENLHRNYNSSRRTHYEEILPKVALRSSEREQLSEKMEYRVRDLMAVKYMADKVGEKFTAKISGMIEKWFFVELENTIEGFVEFGASNMSYNEENSSVSNYITGKEYTFWNEVDVELIRADMEMLRLDFQLVI